MDARSEPATPQGLAPGLATPPFALCARSQLGRFLYHRADAEIPR